MDLHIILYAFAVQVAHQSSGNF